MLALCILDKASNHHSEQRFSLDFHKIIMPCFLQINISFFEMQLEVLVTQLRWVDIWLLDHLSLRLFFEFKRCICNCMFQKRTTLHGLYFFVLIFLYTNSAKDFCKIDGQSICSGSAKSFWWTKNRHFSRSAALNKNPVGTHPQRASTSIKSCSTLAFLAFCTVKQIVSTVDPLLKLNPSI